MISRRQFLQVAGISAYGISSVSLSGAFPFISTADVSFAQVAAYGRVLYETQLKNDIGIVISRLFPDTVVQIVDSSYTTYLLDQGVVNRASVQPMADFGAAALVSAAPAAIEVVAPAAAVRQYCSPTAPLVSRVGHGGVMHVVDSLVVQGSRWLGVTGQSDSAVIGWTEAVRWREVVTQSEDASLADTIEVDHLSQQMRVYDGHNLLWSVGAAISQLLPTGRYSLDGRVASSSLPEDMLLGIPWAHNFGGHELSGAYWHNTFGLASGRSQIGAAIQIPPAAARWIYRHFRSNGTLHVV